MNLSKITIPMMSLVSIISLSTCAAAGTAEIVKKQQLQQLKLFQLSQSQPGKTLKKAASDSKEITIADSIQRYGWVNSSWEKSGCTRYSYDSKGRIKEEIVVDGNSESDTKNTYEYDADGKTVKYTSIWNLSSDGELFMSETTYLIYKYYPGYTNANVVSDMSEYIAILNIENVAGFYDLDSVVAVAFNSAMDTTYKSVTKYTRISDKSGRSNTKFTSFDDDGYGSMNYHIDYTTSGNGMLDTTKCIAHFDGGADSLYEEWFEDMQYMLFVSKTDPNHVVEQMVFTATDSTFSSSIGDIKLSFYTNAKGDIDSMVTQEWDAQQNVWMNTEKAVYSLKKITVGVEKVTNNLQAAQLVTLERKNGTLYLNIPGGMTASEVELLDIQGKLITRTAIRNVKNCVVLIPDSEHSSTVSLVRLKTNRGNFTGKVCTLK